MSTNHHNTNVWQFEKRLLPIKFVYFWSYSAAAALIPFFVTYYFELGLTATELSLIQGAVTFFSFIVRPIISRIADVTNHYRLCLLICLIWCAFLHLPHMFIPKISSDLVLNDSVSGGNWPVAEALALDNSSSFQGYNHSLLLSADINDSSIINSDLVDYGTNLWSLFTNWMCQSRANIFVTLLGLRLIASIGASPALSLIDTFGYALSHSDLKVWGRQRCFSTFGWAFSTLVIGYTLHLTGNHYYLFLMSGAMFLLAAFSVTFLQPLHHHRTDNNEGRNNSSTTKRRGDNVLFKVLCQPQVVVYLIFTIINGVLLAMEYNFLFLFMKENGADELLIGLHQAVDSIVELPMFFFSGHVIKHLGYVPCFCLSFAAYVIRLSSYSFLADPLYLVLLIEITHGFSFTLFLAAGSGYADALTPPNCPATLQGIFHSFYFSLGTGIGELAGGYLYPYIGARHFFRCGAVLAAVCTVIYAALWFVWLCKIERRQMQTTDNSLVVADGALDTNNVDMTHTDGVPSDIECSNDGGNNKRKTSMPGASVNAA